MADDKTKRGGQDRSRINLSEEYEVRYWTEKFDVTRLELEGAAEKVGPMVKDVRRHLKGT
jgi:hypothetical protein